MPKHTTQHPDSLVSCWLHVPMPLPFAVRGVDVQGRQLYVMPAVKDHHEVTVTFQLPCMWQHYRHKAEHYVAHLVGHEGPGSLLSYLKVKPAGAAVPSQDRPACGCR
jgi:hypothetical protein